MQIVGRVEELPVGGIENLQVPRQMGKLLAKVLDAGERLGA